ncbi:MAG: ATP phosphoribosyltransferase regulatory subunit [Alphaproteobacteria bacterium]
MPPSSPASPPSGSRMTLLPPGFADLLPEGAEHEARLTHQFLRSCTLWGYRRVKPPLCEFASITNTTATTAPNSPNSLNFSENEDGEGGGEVSVFRFLDPVSHRILALRNDITQQVARIAAERLQTAPRPLRLCYAGEVLRAAATQIDHERQFLQLGAELFANKATTDIIAAPSEILALAVEALTECGLAPLTIDLAWPRFAVELMEAMNLADSTAATIQGALATRDGTALSHLEGGAIFSNLLLAVGTPKDALIAARKMKLPSRLAAHLDHLEELAAILAKRYPQLAISIDLAESRSFGFQTGLGFSVFSSHARTEIARGGSYRTSSGEPACGFSVYSHLLLRALEEVRKGADGSAVKHNAKIFATRNASHQRVAELRKEGRVVISELATLGGRASPEGEDPITAARDQCCDAILDGDAITPLQDITS